MKNRHKYSEADFQRILFSIYNKRGHYPIIPNFSGLNWEADLFSITRSGMMYEFEIKLSRADFKKELKDKKAKHLSLNNSIRTSIDTKDGTTILSPNHFYFVCPQELIKPEEIPEHAGLIYLCETTKYVSDTVKHIRRFRQNMEILEVKKPKKIHQLKANSDIYRKIAQVYTGRMMYGNRYYDYCKEHGYF